MTPLEIELSQLLHAAERERLIGMLGVEASDSVQTAFWNAVSKQTAGSLQALEREVNKQLEEEDFTVLALLS